MAARGMALRFGGSFVPLALACALLTGTGTASADTFSTLYRFTGDANGNGPLGPLVRATDGNLYGMTQSGGIRSACGGAGCGTVFKMTTSGTLTTLNSFTGGADGAPGIGAAALIQGSDGNLYGTTSAGGTSGPCGGQSTLGLQNSGCGTIFKRKSL